jgi:hypothetical protein
MRHQCMNAFSVIAFSFAFAGCSSPKLKPEVLVDQYFLSAPLDPGAAVGKCVAVQTNGLASLIPCPMNIDTMVKQIAASVGDQGGVRQYEARIAMLSGSFQRLTQSAQGGLAVAHETVTYGVSRVAEWKTDIDEAAYDRLVSFCAAPPENVGLAITETSGCSVHKATASVDLSALLLWTVEALKENHTKLGIGKDFWIDTPKQTTQPKAPSCETKVAVRVEVLPARQFCSQHVVPQQIQRFRAQLLAADSQRQALEKERTALMTQLADYREKLAAHNATLQIVRFQTDEIDRLRRAGTELEDKLKDLEARSRAVPVLIPAIADASATAEGIAKTVEISSR